MITEICDDLSIQLVGFLIFCVREDIKMAAIVQFPAIVEELLKTFGSVFSDKRTREHFGEYLTGLMVAKRKNVSAIGRENRKGSQVDGVSRIEKGTTV